MSKGLKPLTKFSLIKSHKKFYFSPMWDLGKYQITLSWFFLKYTNAPTPLYNLTIFVILSIKVILHHVC
ncbi:hypothetical protein LguiB_005730 [Lonicera macranthoides]